MGKVVMDGWSVIRMPLHIVPFHGMNNKVYDNKYMLETRRRIGESLLLCSLFKSELNRPCTHSGELTEFGKLRGHIY